MTTTEPHPDLAGMEAILTDMQSESGAYLRGVADGVMRCVRELEELIPVIRAELSEGNDVDAAEAFRGVANTLKTRLGVEMAAESLDLHIGNFSAIGDVAPHSMCVRLDDRPIAVTGFTVDWKVGGVPKVNIQIVPIVHRTSNEGQGH